MSDEAKTACCAITCIAAVLMTISICTCVSYVASYRRDLEMADKGYIQEVVLEPIDYYRTERWVKGDSR